MRKTELYRAESSRAGAFRAQPALEFATDNARAGFRLDRLEVFNWGTFHGRVWAVESRGCTALLTGANGSGKSTLVDALLTLLVPNPKRGYNQASGAETKKERDERSYVLGAYGKFRGEEASTSQTRHLREKKSDYSVILGSFYNEGFRQRVVLAHVFYFIGGELRKFFVVSPVDLTIADHFSGFSDAKSLRRRLREVGAQDFDQFSDYSKHFRRVFGMKSEKALDLFNQTVSIKFIGELNSFVRQHMLEPGDARANIADLRRHFDDLTRTHDAITKAKDQIERLRPIDEDGKRHAGVCEKIFRIEASQQALPGIFAKREIDLLEEAKESTTARLDISRRLCASARTKLNDLTAKERELDFAIRQDEVGRQIERLDEEIRHTEQERDRLLRSWDTYRSSAAALGLEVPETEEAFFRQRTEAQSMRSAAEHEIDAAVPERDQAMVDLHLLEEELAQNRAEVESLRERTTQIPFRQLQVRRQLAADLDIPESELPFIGELVQVVPEERAWEGAIERLLHSFALRMLVPERHYGRVNKYVNATHLGDRLVYHRVSEETPARGIRESDPDRLYNKLEIRSETPHWDWLEAQLIRQFDHVCCDLERFRHESFALTQNGLVKQHGTLHEKDDRHRLDDRRRYVLGWDNRDKVRLIEEEIRRLEQRRGALKRIANDVEKRQQALRTRMQLLDDLLRYAAFGEIDKSGAVRKIEALRAQKQRLEESSDHLRQLRAEKDAVTAEVKEADARVREIEREITLLENRLEEFDRRLERCRGTLSIYQESELASGEIDRLIRGELTLETLADRREEVRTALSDDHRKRMQRKQEFESKIIKGMALYKSDYPQETIELDASIESLQEYQRMLATLEREDLPRYEQSFRELLNKKLMEDVSFFEEALDRQFDEIDEKIQSLNVSLGEIAYTGSTYIQLITSASQDGDIRQFRNLLRGIFAGNTGDAAANEASFIRIRDLIHRFETDERWTTRVTDVRNWVDFSISERYRESDAEKNFITNSEGLSGGQKAKLAYTILAAAIAYQFGLAYGETRSQSFRFVVIDEAFSKIDEDNARYAMELFRKLDLQLLVVSPLGATRVVEDYIGACHFVANNEEGSFSQVRNLTIEQFEEEKARVLSDFVVPVNGHPPDDRINLPRNGNPA